MASFPSFSTCSLVVMLIMFLLGLVSADSYYPGKLQQCDDPYYKYSCPSALSTIRDIVELAIAKESRMGASLLRLHFHDCFVNGCDASVLLDNTTATNGEKFAAPNLNSLRGFEVIDAIKLKLELECPRTVSCADILAVVARDSVDILRGNSEMYRTWNVKLGRKDSKTASMDAANRNLPPPFLNLKPLLSFFQSKNFTTQETVVLSGGHTIGKARCTTFRDRIYNESNIQTSFADGLKKICPRSGGDDNLADFDSSTGTFDNTYYTDLVQERGLLHSDQQLYSGGETNRLVESYSKNPVLFFSDFGNAMVKMGDLSPPAGSEPGEVRINCRRRN